MGEPEDVWPGVPEDLWRFPTTTARHSLARRFNLPISELDQDWEWTSADPARIPEFLAAYQSGTLDDDEKFALLEMIIQSFADSSRNLNDDTLWRQTLLLIDEAIELHIHSVWYWSHMDVDPDDGNWYVVNNDLQEILAKHRDRFVGQS